MTTAISSLLFLFHLSTLSPNSVCRANSEVASKNLESKNQVITEY